jgi:hypothetical protein
LGLRVESGPHNVTFAPHLPHSWNTLTLRHVHVGTAELSIQMRQTDAEIQLQVQNTGPPVQMTFAPELPLGATLRDAHVADQAFNATIEQNPQDTHAHVAFQAPSGSTSVTIRFKGGVSVIPSLPTLQVGDPSCADKIVSAKLKNQTLTLTLDRLTSQSSTFQIQTPWKVRNTEGATLEPLSPHLYRVTMPARQQGASPQGTTLQAYQREKVTLTFAESDDDPASHP